MVFGSYGWSSAGLELTLRSAMEAGVLDDEALEVESQKSLRLFLTWLTFGGEVIA